MPDSTLFFSFMHNQTETRIPLGFLPFYTQRFQPFQSRKVLKRLVCVYFLSFLSANLHPAPIILYIQLCFLLPTHTMQYTTKRRRKTNQLNASYEMLTHTYHSKPLPCVLHQNLTIFSHKNQTQATFSFKEKPRNKEETKPPKQMPPVRSRSSPTSSPVAVADQSAEPQTELQQTTISTTTTDVPKRRLPVAKIVHLHLSGCRPTPTSTIRPGWNPRSLQLVADPLAKRKILSTRSPRESSIASSAKPAVSRFVPFSEDQEDLLVKRLMQPDPEPELEPTAICTEGKDQTPPEAIEDSAPKAEAQQNPDIATESTQKRVLDKFRKALMTPQLPPQPPHLAERLTLVLDLDETLIHSAFPYLENTALSSSPPHFQFVMENPASKAMNDLLCTVSVWKRHGLSEFLEKVSAFCEVVVYTASHESYAKPLIAIIDPKGHVHGQLYREHTLPTACGFVKDLSLIGRPLSRVVIIDNNPLSFARNPDNGIAVKSFYGTEDASYSLIHLIPFLEHLSQTPDVRPILRGRFNWAQKMPGYCYQYCKAMQTKAAPAVRRDPHAALDI